MRLIFTVMIFFMLSGCSYESFVMHAMESKAEKTYWRALRDMKTMARYEFGIFEVIKECRQIKANECLAREYLNYGMILRHNLVTRNKAYYVNRGFNDKTVTYENRFEKSVEFIQKAFDLNSKAEPARTCIEKLVREKPSIIPSCTRNCNEIYCEDQ